MTTTYAPGRATLMVDGAIVRIVDSEVVDGSAEARGIISALSSGGAFNIAPKDGGLRMIDIAEISMATLVAAGHQAEVIECTEPQYPDDAVF